MHDHCSELTDVPVCAVDKLFAFVRRPNKANQTALEARIEERRSQSPRFNREGTADKALAEVRAFARRG